MAVDKVAQEIRVVFWRGFAVASAFGPYLHEFVEQFLTDKGFVLAVKPLYRGHHRSGCRLSGSGIFGISLCPDRYDFAACRARCLRLVSLLIEQDAHIIIAVLSVA